MKREINKFVAKKIHFLIFFMIPVVFPLFTSCTHGWKTYVIKSGHHSTMDLNPIKMNLNKISFEFKADSSWYYLLPDNSGWNKIRGLSHGHHQSNSSARLGYRCFGDSILVVGAYCYVDGVSPQKNEDLKEIIDTIQPGRIYHCTISRENGKYIIDFEHRKWIGPAGKDLKWGYLLNPYIGGDFTLDHDWIIEIKDN